MQRAACLVIATLALCVAPWVTTPPSTRLLLCSRCSTLLMPARRMDIPDIGDEFS